MQKLKQSNSTSMVWVIGGSAAVLILIGIIITAVLLILPPKQAAEAMPTSIPTAAVAAVVPTAAPTIAPTPEPAVITLLSPQDGDRVNLGQPVDLRVTASDPNGIRLINLTSNGQGIGIAQSTGETTMELNQSWTPEYAGTHQIVAVATNRVGEPIAAEAINLRVIDQAMMERNAPIWAKVEANVAQLRKLEPLEPVEPTLLSQTELRQRIQADYFFTKEDAADDTLVLRAFDFVARDFDYYSLSRRYIGESIAGFYDPDSKEFVVVSSDDDTNALEQWIYAHEFMHAMQDQHFQLGLITDADTSFESNMALRALAEGEAELVQEYYMDWNYFTESEEIEIFNETHRLGGFPFVSDPGYFPDVLSNAFWFPYTTGRDFAEYIFVRNGWAGLNDAWENLPQSTEQIIHPERYFSGDSPQIVALEPLTDTLGAGWTLVEEGVLGEFFMREYLIQRVDEAVVNAGAKGWGGDRYAVYWHADNDDLVLVLRTAWDTSWDADQFITAYTSYADRRYGPGSEVEVENRTCWQRMDVTCLNRVGDEVFVIRAPDLATAASVAEVAWP